LRAADKRRPQLGGLIADILRTRVEGIHLMRMSKLFVPNF